MRDPQNPNIEPTLEHHGPNSTRHAREAHQSPISKVDRAEGQRRNAGSHPTILDEHPKPTVQNTLKNELLRYTIKRVNRQ